MPIFYMLKTLKEGNSPQPQPIWPLEEILLMQNKLFT